MILVAVLGGVALYSFAPKSTESSSQYDNQIPVSWRVGLAFPSTGIGFLDRSTVGRWSNIANKVKDELVAHGFDPENIIIKQTDNRPDQVEQIDDFVKNENIDCLVVVPVEYSLAELVALNGDATKNYLRHKYTDVKAESLALDDPKILQNSPYEYVEDEHPLTEDDIKWHQDTLKKITTRTLEEALTNAKTHGVVTVGYGNDNLGDFAFDYFFATPSPEDIANVQAGFAVAHLGLPELNENGEPPSLADFDPEFVPKNVEVMVADALRPTSERYFDQLWKRIQPYFAKGYLKSNTGLLNKETTAKDYIGVAITEDGDKAAGVMHNWLDKFYKTDDEAHKLDFIFAQSDALSRGAVRACVESGWNASSSRWPIITGFGAERITASDIVEQKQAMSIAYDSNSLAVGIAQYLFDYAVSAKTLGSDETINNTALNEALDTNTGDVYFSQTQISGALENMLIARPITITSENIKELLVDKGYISPQDAGL